MNQFQIVDATELARAYASARYEVDLGVGVQAVCVGELAAELEIALPAASYAFITAWNPASMPRTQEANAEADARLCARLDAAGAGRAPMRAQDQGGRWFEAGWLVSGLDAAGVDALAREFGQAGVLFWSRGTPVRLRMLLTRPQNAADLPGTDWVE